MSELFKTLFADGEIEKGFTEEELLLAEARFGKKLPQNVDNGTS